MQGDSRIKLLDEVHQHLDVVATDPSTQLDTHLLERCQAVLSPEIPHHLLVRLQGQAIAAFRSLQECPPVLSQLATKAASFITFADVQTFLQLDDLVGGLLAPLNSVSFLALIYLSKAADSPGDAATVGSTPGLVEALIELWLTTSETYISQKALGVLRSLLATDLPHRTTYIDKPSEGRVGNATGQGLVWRRLFHDKNVYELLFALCSRRPRQGRVPSRLGVSNAQGRLFDFLPKAAVLNWDAVATSQLPEIENAYNCHSLLDFAANHMIDNEDFLLKVTRFDFFRALVGLRSVPMEGCSELSRVPSDSSPALEFLTNSGIHREILTYYIQPQVVDQLSLSLMSNVHHRYIATYLRAYPKQFLRDTDTVRSVIDTLRTNLNIRPTAWAHGTPPYADLLILQNLPGSALVETEERGANPLHLVPTSPANAAALHALASVFHGQGLKEDEDMYEQDNEDRNGTQAAQQAESDMSASARTVFLLYLSKHPEFWSNVGAATNVLAMEEAAVMGVKLIRAIATARWSTMASQTTSIGQSSAVSEIKDEYSSVKTGLGALLTLGMQAFQSLLLAPQPIAGAAGSDSSSAAWKIAREKWDTIDEVRRLMNNGAGKDEMPLGHWEAIREALAARITLGPWGRAAEVGSRVQTLEE